MRKFLIAALLIAAPASAWAQSMNAEAFHQRATALQKKGALALFSMGEVKKLMAEGQAAGKRAAQARRAALAAGEKPRFCPPAGKGKMDDNEFMTRLSAIPKAERARIDMTEAVNRILARKYPC
ncbi:MAG TPA: hypothetical protein VIL42_03610 [Sphingomicrobium sp.]|jgi:hypothetical protein